MNKKFTKDIDLKKQTDILELKNSWHEIPNTFESFNNILGQAEGRIPKLEDTRCEIIQ